MKFYEFVNKSSRSCNEVGKVKKKKFAKLRKSSLRKRNEACKVIKMKFSLRSCSNKIGQMKSTKLLKYRNELCELMKGDFVKLQIKVCEVVMWLT